MALGNFYLGGNGIPNDTLRRVAFVREDPSHNHLESYYFTLNPSQITASYPARNIFNQTLRTVLMQGYGMDIHTIQIQGQTGYNKTALHQRGPTGWGTGFQKAKKLKKVITDQINNAHDANSPSQESTLYFKNFTDEVAYKVECDSNGLQFQQFDQDPLTFYYTISMVVIAPAYEPNPDEFSFKKLGNMYLPMSTKPYYPRTISYPSTNHRKIDRGMLYRHPNDKHKSNLQRARNAAKRARHGKWSILDQPNWKGQNTIENKQEYSLNNLPRGKKAAVLDAISNYMGNYPIIHTVYHGRIPIDIRLNDEPAKLNSQYWNQYLAEDSNGASNVPLITADTPGGYSSSTLYTQSLPDGSKLVYPNDVSLHPSGLVTSDGSYHTLDDKVDSTVSSIYLQSIPKIKVKDKYADQVPVLDLSNNASLTPKQQLSNIEYASTPQRAADIANMFSNSGNEVSNVVRTYGVPDADQTAELPSSDDLDQMYQDIFKTNVDLANVNQFLRVEELYAAITGSGLNPETNDTVNGLFTDIDENTMSRLYEIIYGQPMNLRDYHDYLLTGTPNMYNYFENGQLTNDTADGSHLAKFNELKPMVNQFEGLQLNTYNDPDYRSMTGMAEQSNSQPYNPKITPSAVKVGYNDISWELQLNMDSQLPVEAAVYLTGINFDNHHMLQFPKEDQHYIISHFNKEHQLYSLKMSECSLQILRNIIRHIHIVYGVMPKGSLISLINDTALKDDHIGIYDLVRKVILDLYSICYSFKHMSDSTEDYIHYLTYQDLINLRINIKFLKDWSFHYWEYRDFIEVWEDLDQAVAYMLPFLVVQNNSQGYPDNIYFNDNQNNEDGVDMDTGNLYNK